MSHARHFASPDDEAAADARADTMAAVRAQVARLNPAQRRELARKVVEIRRAHGHVKGTTALALARHGHGADSPVTQMAAKGAAKKKGKRGLGWHSVGDLVGGVVEDVGDAVGRGARTVTRGAFTALETPLQELTGAIGDIGTGRSPLRAHSTGLVALGNLIDGDRVDLGHGFFSGGDVRAEQGAVMRDIGKRAGLGDRAFTLGRVVAKQVAEPGSAEFKLLSGALDFGVAVGADPAALATAGVGKAAQARKLFTPAEEAGRLRRAAQAAGLVEGRRKTVLPEVVDQWLTGDGAKVVEALSADTDPVSIWRRSNKKIPVEVARELADATTADEVAGVLRPRLGLSIREKPKLDTASVRVRNHFKSVRLAQAMPGGHIDLDDLDDTMEQAERFLRNAELPAEQVDERLRDLARTTNRVARFEVIERSLGDVAAHVATELGASTENAAKHAREMTTMFRNSIEAMRSYYIDEVGNDVAVLGATVDGNGVPLPTPHLFVEYIDRALPLPDARAIRRATSRYGRAIEKIPAADWGVATLDWAMQDIWKPLVLLRGAWTVRVVGEEQVRMGAAGFDSVFRHPLSAIAFVTGRKGATSLTRETFDDAVEEFAASQSRRGGPWRDRIISAGKRPVARGEDAYAESWGAELLQLESDPIAKRVAGGFTEGDAVPGGLTGNHVDDAKRWFRDGAGKEFREQLGSAKGREALLADRAVADAYVESVWERLKIKTADQRELLDVVRTGRIGDAPIRDGRHVSQSLWERLDDLATQEVGPQKVKGDITLSAPTSAGGKAAAGLDRAVEGLFSVLMSRPTNYLSRSPVFRQSYWKRAEELLPYMDDAGKAKALSAAAEAGMDVKRLRAAAERGTGALTLDEVDDLAKGFALDSTRNLLYDLSNRSQFFDATRLLFPFGEAWKEVVTTWAKLGVQQGGKPVRRAQQLVEGARGAGWFYTDPQTGEEVFAYPGSSFVNEKLTGIPFPMTSNVSGLNIVGATVMPGVGPVVQFPASYLIPNVPEWDWMREALLPFGSPDVSGGFVESQLPAWMQKLRKWHADPESDRTFGNTVGDVARYLVSTGEYNTRSPEAYARLIAAATSKARRMYVIRGAAQFAAPSAPRFQARAKVGPEVMSWLRTNRPDLFDGDKLLNGVAGADAIAAQLLIDDFRRMQDEDYDSAVETFLTTYREGALLLMQPKTRTLTVGAPTSKQGNDWARSNPELREKFPNVYGLFAPEGDDFSIAAYERQLRTGEREPLTPEEMVKLANGRVASMLYNAARNHPDADTTHGREWLRTIRTALMDQYPGYGESFGLAERARTPQLLAELEEAAHDPHVATTDAGKGLGLYLLARSRAQDAAEAQGLVSFTKAKSARSIREWLRGVADAITANHPDFARVYDLALSRELPDEGDDDEAVAA